MIKREALYSSATEEWATPQSLFDALDDEFHFTLDPCATAENAKCVKYYTKAQDGLAQDWTGETVFCNPPYGRKIEPWIRKAYEHFIGGGYCGSSSAQQDRYAMVPQVGLRKS